MSDTLEAAVKLEADLSRVSDTSSEKYSGPAYGGAPVSDTLEAVMKLEADVSRVSDTSSEKYSGPAYGGA
ncbi:hypothetical protein, partial [Achromobacter sp.]|uniref:hypothetical protein n=1 Tax=Achromobacter sp. TaxID=134375 RepID=UPI0028A8C714